MFFFGFVFLLLLLLKFFSFCTQMLFYFRIKRFVWNEKASVCVRACYWRQ